MEEGEKLGLSGADCPLITCSIRTLRSGHQRGAFWFKAPMKEDKRPEGHQGGTSDWTRLETFPLHYPALFM